MTKWYKMNHFHPVKKHEYTPNQTNSLKLVVEWIKNNPSLAHIRRKKKYPKIDIFYVGLGKAGSTSIFRGFPDNNVMKVHGTSWVFTPIQPNYLASLFYDFFKINNLDIYDLILFFSSRYEYKPLITESIREPVSCMVSSVIQHLKNNSHLKDKCDCDVCWWKLNGEITPQKLFELFRKKMKPESIEARPNSYPMPHTIDGMKKHFDIDILKEFDHNSKYFYKETNKIKFLFTRFEDIKDRQRVFSSIGYNYVETHQNKTSSEKTWDMDIRGKEVFKSYHTIKSNPNLFRFNSSEIKHLYSNKMIQTFYSPKEIESFIKKHTEK